ncbi:MAG: amidohydrolase family protein [Kordiimonadaceae bacterium]|nr:amidohydrolase family protein [Kordiimonadaceae bacterium]
MADLIITGGTVITIDKSRQIINEGAIVIDKDRIIFIGPAKTISDSYTAQRVIDATGKVIIPGLIDVHAHAGHALVKTIAMNGDWEEFCGKVYTSGSTPEYWYAEARLAALERLRFGVTCGVSLLGGGDTIMRTDDPVYADAHCQGVLEVGTRSIVAVGPTRAPHPLTYAKWDGDQCTKYPVDFERQIATCENVLSRWHKAGNDCINIAMIYPVLRNEHQEKMTDTNYEEAKRQAQHVRAISKEASVLFTQDGHTGGSVKRAHDLGLLGPDALLSHATNLSDEEIAICAETNTRIAHNPSAVASIYGYCPVIDLIDAGVTVGLGSDATAPDRSSDMFRHIQQLMHYHRTHYGDASYMPPGKALEMATIDGANALGLGDEIGSLEVGKRADITIVDMQSAHMYPVHMEAFRLACYANGNDVDTMIVGGEIMMEDKIPTRVNKDDILKEAGRETDAMIERMDAKEFLELPDGFWGQTRYS